MFDDQVTAAVVAAVNMEHMIEFPILKLHCLKLFPGMKALHEVGLLAHIIQYRLGGCQGCCCHLCLSCGPLRGSREVQVGLP